MGSYFRDFYSPKATQRPTVGDTKFSVINQDHMGWLNCDGRGLSTSTYNILFQTVGYSFGGSGNTFNLPDARGRVPGAVGNPDVNTLNPTTYVLGDVSGNQLHILTVPEIPAHNHDYTGGQRDLSGNTSYSLTGVTVNSNTTGITVDLSGAHNHGGVTGNAAHSGNQGLAAAGGGNYVAEDEGVHSHTISTDGNHTHSITDPSHAHDITDPTHRHMIAPNGGDLPHNNMQPTIFMGNMFIFSGKYGAGFFPYAANTNIF
jgi:microcystin-dependent protein